MIFWKVEYSHNGRCQKDTGVQSIAWPDIFTPAPISECTYIHHQLLMNISNNFLTILPAFSRQEQKCLKNFFFSKKKLKKKISPNFFQFFWKIKKPKREKTQKSQIFELVRHVPGIIKKNPIMHRNGLWEWK